MQENEGSGSESPEDAGFPNALMLDEGLEAVFCTNTHYEDLIVYPPNGQPEPAFFTYEGFRRCHVCFLLKSSLHRTSDTDCGLEHYSSNRGFCSDCGKPYSSGSKFKKDQRRHPLRCPKIMITEDAYDHTLHCPKCGAPGFAWKTINRHIKSCDGNRQSMLNDHRYQRQGLGTGDSTRCPDCNFSFRNKLYGEHVCGAICDPVWLGNEIPDMAKPYIAWCAERPEGLGYGGAMLVNGLGKAIQADVVARSYHVPYAVKHGYGSSGPSDVTRLFTLVRRLAFLVNELWDTRLDGEARSGEGLLRVSIRTMSSMTLGEKITWLEKTCNSCMEVRNRELLSGHMITFDNVTIGPCPGVGWKHGWFPCLWGNTIDLSTIKARINEKDPARLRLYMALPCVDCVQFGRAIWNWIARGKYNADGTRLCPHYRCREPVIGGGIECAKHRKYKEEANLATALRRLENRSSQDEERKHGRRRKLHRLWRTVSPELMQDFLSGLLYIEQLPWQHDPVWIAVAAGLSGVAGRPVYFVDTEATLRIDHTPIIFSIAVVDTAGSVLLHETIDYGKTIAELCGDVQHRFLSYACRVYNAVDASEMTKGIKAQELRRRLEEIGLSPHAIMVEWSANGWDQRAIQATFGDGLVADHGICGNNVWRLSGYSGPMDLQTLHHLCFPHSPLRVRHHVADYDALKLYEVMRRILLSAPGDGGSADMGIKSDDFDEDMNDVSDAGSFDSASELGDSHDFDLGDEDEEDGDEEYGFD